MRRFSVVAGIIVVGVLAASCGGQEEASTPAGGDEPSGATGIAGNEGGSAAVTLGGTTHEFGDNRGCTLPTGTIIATFENGDDSISMTSSETDGVVLIRMTLDGVTWSYSGRDLPDVSGNTVNWSGDVSPQDQGQVKEAATVTITC